jgi:hypothetical protein
MLAEAYPVTRTARDDIEYILSVWQGRLNLTHWVVKVDWDEPLEDVEANIMWGSYDQATVRFNTAHDKWSRRYTNETVVHELLHLVLRDLQNGVESAEAALSASAYRLFENRFQHELEGVVERLALLLVGLGGEV